VAIAGRSAATDPFKTAFTAISLRSACCTWRGARVAVGAASDCCRDGGTKRRGLALRFLQGLWRHKQFISRDDSKRTLALVMPPISPLALRGILESTFTSPRRRPHHDLQSLLDELACQQNSTAVSLRDFPGLDTRPGGLMNLDPTQLFALAVRMLATVIANLRKHNKLIGAVHQPQTVLDAPCGLGLFGIR